MPRGLRARLRFVCTWFVVDMLFAFFVFWGGWLFGFLAFVASSWVYAAFGGFFSFGFSHPLLSQEFLALAAHLLSISSSLASVLYDICVYVGRCAGMHVGM